jgi:epoxyqueuosine reductase
VNNRDHTAIIETIQAWARELGFQDIGFTGVNLHEHEAYLEKWLQAGYHGTMDWMDRHGSQAQPSI